MARNKVIELQLLSIVSMTLLFNEDSEVKDSAELLLTTFRISLIIKNHLGIRIDSFEIYHEDLNSKTLGLFSHLLTKHK